MKIGNRYLAGMGMLLALVIVSSCSKLSHVGDQSEPTPHAVATTIGESYTRDGSGNLQATVRAGSEVVLTGKDSEKGDDDTGVPLVNFKWEQLSPGSNAVQLIARTANTVSFTAPQVSSSSALTFKLTVSDVKGNSATTQATITVLPVRDQDHFLQYLNVSNTIPVVLATQSAIAADTSASATATLPVTVTITKLVTFPDRSDASVTHTRVAVGTPITITSGWNTKLGSSASCSGNENPTIQVPVPRLNQDDLLPSGAFPDAVILSDLLEAADIDKATLEVRVDISSSNSAVSASTPMVCVGGTASSSGTPVAASASTVTSWTTGTYFPTEVLLANAAPRDSKTAAQAYYATIDPSSSKDTLNKWLNANGFDASVGGWSADAHTVYTNNFDLGFGRDMYMKLGGATGKCDNGTSALPLATSNIGKCDVAAVVLNYSGVEAAAKKLNPINAVAMEYSTAPGGSTRIVKFYVFAPDTRTGEFTRVLTANLDRRGEQYVPQMCVVCHGGTPGTVTNGQYSSSGDVNAGFLPWDLDSLLYSDTDPGFSSKSRDATLRTQYTRAAQEAQFKLLNTGAYLTFADPAAVPGRYALLHELLEGWYHGNGATGLAATTFDGAFVPEGWKPSGLDGMANTADDNPADSASIYSNVFARNCRMCHSLQVPATGDPRTATVTVNSVSIAACTNDARLANSRVGAAFQVPMGCYWEFAHAPNLADRLARNQMPFARRTSDRTWVNSSGAQTAGATLQAHLLSAQSMTVATPGTVSACIDTSFGTQVQDQGTTKYQVARNAWVNLSSNCSRFVITPHWTLSAPSGSNAVLVGADTAAPRFVADKQGDYTLALSDGATATATVIAQVAVVTPVAGSASTSIPISYSTPPSSVNQLTTDVDVRTLSGYNDHGHTALSDLDSVASINIKAAGLVADGCTASCTIQTTSGINVTSSDRYTMHVAISALPASGYHYAVNYSLSDGDGDESNVGSFAINLSATITAKSPTISATTNTAKSIDLSSSTYVSYPSGTALTFSITVQPNLPSRATAVTGTVTPSSGSVVIYSPPTATTSRSKGGITVGANDQFSFQVCQSGTSNCSTGVVTVVINGTTDFAADILDGTSGSTALRNGGCAGCHYSITSDVALTGANSHYNLNASCKSNYQLYTMFTTEAPALACNPTYETTCVAGNGTTSDFSISKFVNLTSPSSSLLFLKPQNKNLSSSGTVQTGTSTTLYHGGAGSVWLTCDTSDVTHYSAAGCSLLSKIQTWISEGAYYTETDTSTSSCP